jgi:hypothetical protein
MPTPTGRLEGVWAELRPSSPFENTVLRRTFAPRSDVRGGCRKMNNGELLVLLAKHYEDETVGHASCMGETMWKIHT